MKIETTRNALAGAVARVSKAISAANPGALGCVLIKGDADGCGVTLTGTNIDVTLTAKVECHVEGPCAVAVPAKLLNSLLSALPEGVLHLEGDNEARRLEVRSDVGRARFSCHDAGNFPESAGGGENLEADIPVAVLREILRKTAFAVATDETRKEICNLLFAFSKKGLCAVGTNGRILAKVEYDGLDLSDGFDGVELMLPPAACALLADKSVLGVDGTVRVSTPKKSRSYATFEGAGATLRTRLYDGTYPNYRHVIPERGETPARIDRRMLLDALERASIFSAAGGGGYVAFGFSKGSLVLRSQKSEAGATAEIVPVSYSGGDVRAFLAPRYVIPILKACDDDEIEVSVHSPLKPVLFACSIPFLAVVMPVSLPADEAAEYEKAGGAE